METKIHRYYKDDNFYVGIEPQEGIVLFHVIVYEWKPSVLRQMYIVCGRLFEDMAFLGYPKAGTITPNPKFAKLFGGTVVNELMINDKRHEVIVWELV